MNTLNRHLVLVIVAIPLACLAQDRAERDAAENPEYYRKFSLPKAYPMGINIVVHALSQ